MPVDALEKEISSALEDLSLTQKQVAYQRLIEVVTALGMTPLWSPPLPQSAPETAPCNELAGGQPPP